MEGHIKLRLVTVPFKNPVHVIFRIIPQLEDDKKVQAAAFSNILDWVNHLKK